MNLHIVNAFTADGQNGNPAGVVLSADALSARDMLRTAARAGLSETAFVSSSKVATRKVRFFTPTTEVDLCGHATIATWSLLHELGIVPAGSYSQETLAGVLKVVIQKDGLVFMEQAKARFFEKVLATNIVHMLGIAKSEFHASLQPQIVSTGIKDLLVPVVNAAALAHVRPDLKAIAEFSRQHDISGFHVFALLNELDLVAAARNFAPADGIPEECATGTSNGALLCYLKNENALAKQDMYKIEQGKAMGKVSYIYGMFRGQTIWVGGRAAVRL
jgi:PhzF family phenazine biosynthesis protein